jgi:hypothetical protein
MCGMWTVIVPWCNDLAGGARLRCFGVFSNIVVVLICISLLVKTSSSTSPLRRSRSDKQNTHKENMSRSTVFGPGSTFSLTKYGKLKMPVEPIPRRMRDASRIENNAKIAANTARERRYSLCSKCGTTTVTIGFDQTPSARLGLWGRCTEAKDYTHHKFVALSKGEYDVLRDLPVDERLSRWRFER